MVSKISVIVPVYNVKNYLERCINSIINQTYHNLEIILVDDGSTDGSSEICDCLAQEDDRIIVIHKENGGAASARNCGLDIVTGDFIGFVDSDDYIAQDMYERLYKHMNQNIDIASCGTVYLGKNNRNYVRCKAKGICVMKKETALKELLLHRLLCFSTCDKLFRRDLINNIRFVNGRVCEDLPFIYELVKKSRNIVNIGEAKYFYSYRENSVSRMPFTHNRFDYILFTRDIYKDICNSFPELINAAEFRYINNIQQIINQIENSGDREKYQKEERRLIKAIKNMFFRILCNPYFDRTNKLEYVKLLIVR